MGINRNNAFLLIGGLIFLLILKEEEVSAAARVNNCGCNLKYNPNSATGGGGCIIGRPPLYSGFKCRCRVGMLFFAFPHCVGSLVPCDTNENCPAACASKECCLKAGGDCNGY